jgi:uncharacterized protein YndB with AHSA1/START domain
MSKLEVAAEGTTRAALETVWSLVADANSYPRWGPWRDGGYRSASSGPSHVGSIQWFRYGRRSLTVEEILEVDEPRRLAYTVVKGLPVKGYRAEVVLTPTGSNGTAVRWSASWDQTILGRIVQRRLRQVYVQVVNDLVGAADQQASIPGPAT